MLPKTLRLYTEFATAIHKLHIKIAADAEELRRKEENPMMMLPVEEFQKLLVSQIETLRAIAEVAEEELNHYMIIPYSNDKEKAN
jgi:hypothetical protein